MFGKKLLHIFICLHSFGFNWRYINFPNFPYLRIFYSSIKIVLTESVANQFICVFSGRLKVCYHSHCKIGQIYLILEVTQSSNFLAKELMMTSEN